MNWFQGKNKRKRPSRSRSTSHQPWDPQRTLVGLKVLALVAVVTAVVAGWGYAERRLGAYAAELSGPTVYVDLTDAPSWMNPILLDELRRTVANQVGRDPLDNDGLQRAALALSANPWIERVGRVQRCHTGVVRVYAQYRQPVAVVQGRDGYHLVSDQGVRLPGLYLSHQLDQLALPLIVGTSQAPGREGEVWPGADLHAGLSLVALLQDQSYWYQVRQVDVGHRDARGRMRLVMRTGEGVVRWGFPPGDERAIEPPALTKKRWLGEVYRQRGSIDAGGKIVEVFGPAVFVHQRSYDDETVRVGYTWSR